jgi:hypothetical protein
MGVEERLEAQEMRAELTFEQRIAAAYAHYCQGVPQDVIASILLVNMGRVNEACLAIKQAAKRGRKIEEREVHP